MIVIDARGLEPPEPFERLVDALARAPQGEPVMLVLDREPFELYRFLERNRYRYRAEWIGPDECRWEVRIWDED